MQAGRPVNESFGFPDTGKEQPMQIRWMNSPNFESLSAHPDTKYSRYQYMRIIKRILLICIALSAILVSCGQQTQSDLSLQPVSLLSSSRLNGVISDRTVTYFQAGNDIYYWKIGENRPQLVIEDAFANNDGCYMAIDGEDLCYTRWGDTYLYRYNASTKELQTIADIWDINEPTPEFFAGQFWLYDGKFYCLKANLYAGEEFDIVWLVRICDREGQWLETIALPDNVSCPILAYGDWFFYATKYQRDADMLFQDYYAFNLQTKEKYLLSDHTSETVDTVLDGDLKVETNSDGFYLQDSQGNRASCTAAGCDIGYETVRYSVDDGNRRPYYDDRVLYDVGDGTEKELLACKKMDKRVVQQDILYFQTESWIDLLDEDIQLVDLTGEWSEAAAQANESRSFPETGENAIFALMPDKTLYLLAAGERE